MACPPRRIDADALEDDCVVIHADAAGRMLEFRPIAFVVLAQRALGP